MSSKTSGDVTAKAPGRPRDEGARQKILESALELLKEDGLAKATCDSIAARAGVGKATVYRWWPNKAAVMVEAFRRMVTPEVPFPDTGSVEEDVRRQVLQFTRMLEGPRGRMLAAIVAAAHNDPVVAAALSDYWVAPRRAEAKEAMLKRPHWAESAARTDPDLILDLLYGPMYYRLLMNFPLNDAYAEQLTGAVLRLLQAV